MILLIVNRVTYTWDFDAYYVNYEGRRLLSPSSRNKQEK